ncbi:hypothetical protein ABK040_002560 [Willaertia magna]
MFFNLLFLFFLLFILVLLVLVTIIILFFNYSQNKVINVKTKLSIPRVSLKDIFLFLSDNRNIAIRAYELIKRYNYKPVMNFYVVTRPFIDFGTPEAAKIILTHWREAEKNSSFLTPHMIAFMGKTNLVFVNGDNWKRQRSIINPAFYNIDRFSQLFWRKSTLCLDTLEKMLIDRNELIIHPAHFSTRLTLDILGEAAFGYNFNSLSTLILNTTNKEEDMNIYLEAYQYIMDNMCSFKRLFLGKLYSNIRNEDNKKMNDSLSLIDQLIYSIIRKRKEEIENNEYNNTMTIEKEKTLLDMMIEISEEHEEKFTEEELRDNVLIFFLAGHDTTSAAISFLLCELGKNLNIQEKLYKEIIKVFSPLSLDINNSFDASNHNNFIEKLQSIEYLDWVIKENLRLHPPIPLLSQRLLTKSLTIEGYKIPKGHAVSVNIYALHMDPKYWSINNNTKETGEIGSDVKEFIPERFNSENSKNRPHCSFLPFSYGFRKCIGANFSLLEQKIFIVNLLLRFKVEPVTIIEKEVKESNEGFMFTLSKESKVKLVKREL